MSLIFRIKSVHIKSLPIEEQVKFLEDRNLKSTYSNLKARKTDAEGFTEYKQRSRTAKTDPTQSVRVKIDDNIYMIGEYKNAKFKSLRQKRGPRKSKSEPPDSAGTSSEEK